MNDHDQDRLITVLGQARLEGRALPDPLPDLDGLDEDAGYAAQWRLARWLDAHVPGGVAGFKIGATTMAMQDYLNVSHPAYGHVRAADIHPAGSRVAGPWHCPTALECELAVRLGDPLPANAAPWSLERLLPHIGAVAPAVEIVQNRYGDFQGRGIGALVADDFFHKACIIGDWIDEVAPDALPAMAVSLHVDGEEVEHGQGASVLGNPLEAAVWLANRLASQGHGMKAGAIVLTGSMTPVHWLDHYPRKVEARLSGVGSVSYTMGD